MKTWIIIIESEGKILEITIEAKYYSDAWREAEKQLPEGIIKTIAEANKLK